MQSLNYTSTMWQEGPLNTQLLGGVTEYKGEQLYCVSYLKSCVSKGATSGSVAELLDGS
jgi:hypothetical protein